MTENVSECAIHDDVELTRGELITSVRIVNTMIVLRSCISLNDRLKRVTTQLCDKVLIEGTLPAIEESMERWSV
jgi:hypothetical protein